MNKKDKKEENKNIEPAPERWHIDMDWYQRNNRSFDNLARGCLCHKCAAKPGAAKSPHALLTSLKECCSRSPDFITDQTPIMKSIFCLFLATGNQPLTMAEIGTKLSEYRGGDTYRTAPEILSRLLRNDRSYGLHEVEAAG